MGRSLRLSGVTAVVVLWTSLLAAAVVARFDLLGGQPLSYLGTRAGSGVLFSAGLLGGAVLLTAFHQHVRRRYPVSTGFSVAMLAGMAAQVVAALVPIGGDPAAHRVHTASALFLGASLPVLMWRFAAAQPAGPWRRSSYRLFWAEAGASLAGFALSARGLASLAEVLPAVVFHAWVLTVTFSPRLRLAPGRSVGWSGWTPTRPASGSPRSASASRGYAPHSTTRASPSSPRATVSAS